MFHVSQRAVGRAGFCALALSAFAVEFGCNPPASPIAPASTQRADAERPNIIFILTDDQACRAISTEGNKVVQTPNLQRLADEGTYFSRAYVPLPQCAPSRGAMMTGRYPHERGPISNVDGGLKPDSLTLGSLLKQAGYRCGMIGKWHLGDPRGGSHFGFDDFWAYAELKATPRDEKYTRPVFVANGVEQRHERWLGDVATDYALEFISQDDSRPFFLWLGFHEPHVPITPHPKFPVDPASVQLPTSINDSLESKPAAQRNGDPHKLFLQTPPETLRKQIAAYYSMIASVDANVGRIVERLRQRGVAERTLVVFISDNGWMLGEHQMWTKGGMLYEELVRMPVIFWQPGTVPAGRKVDSLVTSMDFFPTFAKLGKASNVEPLSGIDIWPLVTGTGTAVQRDEIYLEYRGGEQDRPDYFEPMLGVVTAGHKYTRYLASGEEELYDLANDPYEMKNLAASADAADVLKNMRGRLGRFQSGIKNRYWEKPASGPASRPAGREE
ncbi:MAG: sulfatase-like hydrolase/transferase [Planctomycetes bacterium]|nr:sulfatase-like hydrolase/transferase [Planctomycetota bacterium]